MADYSFLKPLFGADGTTALNYDQFTAAMDTQKEIKIGNLSDSSYVANGKYAAVMAERGTLKSAKDEANKNHPIMIPSSFYLPSRMTLEFQPRTAYRIHHFYPRRQSVSSHIQFLSTPLIARAVLGRAFLSTPPSRVATRIHLFKDVFHRISIHATLAGGDCGRSESDSDEDYFYPRHPRGWRLPSTSMSAPKTTFLSTPPSRVATLYPR